MRGYTLSRKQGRIERGRGGGEQVGRAEVATPAKKTGSHRGGQGLGKRGGEQMGRAEVLTP